MSHVECLVACLENLVFEVVVHGLVFSRLVDVENDVCDPDNSDNQTNKFEEVVYIGDDEDGGTLQCMSFDCWSDYS